MGILFNSLSFYTVVAAENLKKKKRKRNKKGKGRQKKNVSIRDTDPFFFLIIVSRLDYYIFFIFWFLFFSYCLLRFYRAVSERVALFRDLIRFFIFFSNYSFPPPPTHYVPAPLVSFNPIEFRVGHGSGDDDEDARETERKKKNA